MARPVRQIRLGHARYDVDSATAIMLQRLKEQYQQPIKNIIGTVLFEGDTYRVLDKAFKKRVSGKI